MILVLATVLSRFVAHCVMVHNVCRINVNGVICPDTYSYQQHYHYCLMAAYRFCLNDSLKLLDLLSDIDSQEEIFYF